MAWRSVQPYCTGISGGRTRKGKKPRWYELTARARIIGMANAEVAPRAMGSGRALAVHGRLRNVN